MSNLVEKILQPISADQPCGPDLSYDPRLDELENLLKGQPEVEIGSVVKPAEPPDWRQLKGGALEFLGSSKHLRVAVIATCALLRVDGLPGFRDGLQIVRGLVENQWAALYPLLDPEDNNDPQQRLNSLGGLAAPRQSVSGWLQISEFLHTAPLCRPKGAPPITLEDILNARKKEGDSAAPGPTAAQLASAFDSASLEEVQANHEAAIQAQEALAGLDAFLTSTLGSGGTISFEELRVLLQQIERTLAPRATGGAAAPISDEAAAGGGETDAQGASGGGMSGFAGIAIGGSIRSRDDVVKALDSICEYYRQVEPGSPVPLLLRRAQKMAKMDFMQAMQELALATPDQLRPSLGSVIDDLLASAAPPPSS